MALAKIWHIEPDQFDQPVLGLAGQNEDQQVLRFSEDRDLKLRFVHLLDVRTFVMRRADSSGAVLLAISGHNAEHASDGKKFDNQRSRKTCLKNY
jgi:hypothetical protein